MALALAAELLAGLSAQQCEEIYRAVRYEWEAWARPKQLAPEGHWDVWALVAGRGAGKTRPGAEWTIDMARRYPGARWALVARTAADVRDTIVLGESGILACSPPWFRPKYFPTRRLLLWPNDFEAHLYSADAPDLLRGPQHHGGWGDEFASWQYSEAWSNLQDGCRLGDEPQILLTSTPRRVPLFLDTVLGPRDPETNRRPVTSEMVASGEWEFTLKTKDRQGREVVVRTVARRWSTEENSLNLSAGFAAKRRAIYGASAFGRQELDADIQEIVEGALWALALIDKHRVPEAPPSVRRVVSVDPSHSDDGRNDACGIVVSGLGDNKHGYVYADRSLHASPLGWGRAAVQAYDDFRCDLIVYESTAMAGKADVVPDVIRTVDPKSRIKWLGIHASRDKRTRADPVASLYEQGRVHHVENKDNPLHLAALEAEMAGWDPWDPKAKSPNRVDALVHGLTYLMLQGQAELPPPQGVGKRPSPWRI